MLRMTVSHLLAFLFLTLFCFLINGFCAEEPKSIPLAEPDMSGGKPLMQALLERKSIRTYDNREIPLDVLSNLLWAACGVNRSDGRRTAPTAVNWQEIDVYVAMSNGLYLYDAANHTLRLILKEDIRKATGKQPFVESAPVNLVYVADFSRMGTASEKQKAFYSATDTGFISQNVYLFCASEGLATVVRGHVDKDMLAQLMGLTQDQHVILAQSVGYPAP